MYLQSFSMFFYFVCLLQNQPHVSSRYIKRKRSSIGFPFYPYMSLFHPAQKHFASLEQVAFAWHPQSPLFSLSLLPGYPKYFSNAMNTYTFFYQFRYHSRNTRPISCILVISLLIFFTAPTVITLPAIALPASFTTTSFTKSTVSIYMLI
jgi:hypothetical protein